MAKLKIVQLESFYGSFLQDFHARHPGLQDLPHAEQIRRLLDSGYSGGHNVVPYLNPGRWQAHYIVPNCPWSQGRWMAERGQSAAGVPATEILARQLEAIEPDVLYLSDIPGFDFSILARLKRRPVVVGWHATIVDERIRWSEIDLVLSGIAGIRSRAVALGAKAAATYMPAAPAHRSVGARPGGGRDLGDLVFSGSFAGAIHAERALQYRELSRRIGERHLDIHSSARFETAPGERIRFFPPVFGADVLDLYADYRVVLDGRGEFNLGDGGTPRETSNMRVFEATRAGALLLTQASANLPEYFEIGREIETFGSTDELVEKAVFYTDPRNEAARLKIAAAGFERVMKDHLIEHRAVWFERILRQHLDLAPAGHATGGTAPSASAGKHLICTTLDRQSFIFGLASLDNLLTRYPDSLVHAHCRDAESLTLLRETGLPVRTLTDAQVLQATSADDGEASLGQPAGRAVRLVQALAALHPDADRVTFIDSSLDVTDTAALAWAAGDARAFVLDHGFGPDLAHAASSVGARSLALLSIGAGQDGLGALVPVLHKVRAAQHGASEPAQVALLESGLAEAGRDVAGLTAVAPWNFDAARSSDSGLFLYFLVRLRNMSTAEYLALEPAERWAACYARHYVPYWQRVAGLMGRFPRLAQLGDQSCTMAGSALSGVLQRHVQLAKNGFRLMTAEQYRGFRNDALGWDNPSVAATQHNAFRYLMGEYEAGRRRADLQALEGVMARLLRPGMRVLEEGCGSGYNGEFLRRTVCPQIEYTGIDLATSMIDLARQTYPDAGFAVMPSEALDFEDGRFDVVLNGASLMHTVDYELALQEAARTAGQFVVLHTVTVADVPENVHFEKSAYGSNVVEVCFSERDLSARLKRHGLEPVLLQDSLDYNLESVIGARSRSVTVACQRLPVSAAAADAASGINYYCTYFDSNYLPRGILMMESMTRHDPKAFFFVLCLDEVSERVVRAHCPNAVAIGLAELLAADPEFAACRDNRSQIEFYFTATSAFVHHLLGRYPQVPRLTYLDADLYFYSSPEFLLYEAREASAQIIEHRFSAGLEQLMVYGRFNVGWIGFFNTPEGRQLVADYRADCIEWCYDRLEGDRFGDQKYLDRWPSRYPSVCVSQNMGANVGPWNLTRPKYRRFGDDLFVDADRLVFFHFQGIKRVGEGEYATKQDAASYGPYYDMFYAGYLKELGAVDARLKDSLAEANVRDIRYNSW